MATAIKVCAGAAHYITYQPTGGTLYTMPYKNLTDNVVPREISVQASGALTPETVVFGVQGDVQWTAYDVTFQNAVDGTTEGLNGTVGTLIIYRGAIGSSGATALKTFHGRFVTTKADYSISDGVTYDCKLTPDTLPAHLSQTANMYTLEETVTTGS